MSDKKAEYRRAIGALETVGMPVDFLRTVARDYDIDETARDGAYVSPVFDTLYLEASEWRSLGRHLALGDGGNEWAAVQTLYHESTHAWLDLKRDEAAVAALRAHGEAHYADAPMRGGDTASDPARLFQEGMAMYVAGQALAYYRALDRIATMSALIDRLAWEGSLRPTDPFVDTVVAEIRLDYNAEVAEPVHAYQDRPWYRFDGSQWHTTRPLSERMRRFARETLLEGAIPRVFGQDPRLSESHAALVEQLERQRRLVPFTVVP